MITIGDVTIGGNSYYSIETLAKSLRNVPKQLQDVNMYLLFHKSASFSKVQRLISLVNCVDEKELKKAFRPESVLIERLLLYFPENRSIYEKAIQHSNRFLEQTDQKKLRRQIIQNLWKGLEIEAWIHLMSVDEHFVRNRNTYRKHYKNDCKGLAAKKKALGI